MTIDDGPVTIPAAPIVTAAGAALSTNQAPNDGHDDHDDPLQPLPVTCDRCQRPATADELIRVAGVLKHRDPARCRPPIKPNTVEGRYLASIGEYP